jgi:hypothetical protein
MAGLKAPVSGIEEGGAGMAPINGRNEGELDATIFLF